MSITMEDIKEDLYMMVEIIGIEKFIEICKIYGGSAVYIPSHKKLLMSERNKNIKEEFDGSNTNYLRQKYNLTNSQIRNLVYKR